MPASTSRPWSFQRSPASFSGTSARRETEDGLEDSEHRQPVRVPSRSLQPSPLSRHMLFSPRDVSLRSTTPDVDIQNTAPSFSDTQSNIRASSVELSGMNFSSSLSVPQTRPSGPSALSILMSESRTASHESNRSADPENEDEPEPVKNNSRMKGRDIEHQQRWLQRPQLHKRREIERMHTIPSESDLDHAPASTSSAGGGDNGLPPPATESTPLISQPRSTGLISSIPLPFNSNPKRGPHIPSYRTVLHAIPAVIFGLLINILDGVSYGMIVFPTTGIYSTFGGTGVSMFFVSTVIAQLVFTFGGSGFAGANGSMMIEVVPFFHIIANKIAAEIGDSDPQAAITTTMMAFALSSILTGLTFLALGFLNLGVLIGFFPRHILIGCIGGIGIFLIETGFEVAVGIEEGFNYNGDTFSRLFKPHNIALWAPALGLAFGLRLITRRWNHQLVFPSYFLAIPAVFYIVVAIGKLDLNKLRQDGWLFDMGDTTEPWYHFYAYFDFRKTNYRVLWDTIPTQLALLFFNILHPPLNVPALAVSLDQDINTNKELVGHGYSNLLAGLIGTVPNYLVYVNTVLFYRVGGNTRFASFMLAAGTALLLLIGTGPIGYIPIMVVTALIFVLGMDLVKEALWDTWPRANVTEYITIISIVICMTLWDFVAGVLFGIVVSCFFFVVQNSRARSIRTIYTGDSALSAVRRPGGQREYIREVARQTVVMKLQGHLFFGTINGVETEIRSLLEPSAWLKNPIRFLILDLSFVAGIDLSSAEAFVRIQRLLLARRIILVFCGFTLDSEIGEALKNVELFKEDDVELFLNLNDALEWTENAYLRAWFVSNKIADIRDQKLVFSGRRNFPSEHLVGSMAQSPRRSQLWDAGGRILQNDSGLSNPDIVADPQGDLLLETLTKAFSSYSPIEPDIYRPLTAYLTRITVKEGEILWRQGEPSDALYLIESGVLRASYSFLGTEAAIQEESMVAGTVAGELSAVSGMNRNATVVVEQDAVLWRLSMDELRRMEVEDPGLAQAFIRLIIKSAKVEYDILLTALAARQ